ncbi:unnamed protein product [Owenia fusiformis]|uniref:Uncharacterized protein n=1 Tax=Owenia fusiformis TaxID=6347 RepID=A0A8J1TYL9_OWEFU|nr:unnamed protein product [Owenia fusiformis]
MVLRRIMYALLKVSFFVSFILQTNVIDADESIGNVTTANNHDKQINKDNVTNYTGWQDGSPDDTASEEVNKDTHSHGTKLDGYSKPFAIHLGFPKSKNTLVIKWYTQNMTNCTAVVEPVKSIGNANITTEELQDGKIQHTYTANIKILKDEYQYRITCGKLFSTNTYKISNEEPLNHANDPTKLAIVPNVFKSDEHEVFSRLIRELEELDIDGLAVYDGDVEMLQNLRAIVTRLPVMILHEIDEKIITVHQNVAAIDSDIHADSNTEGWYIKLTNTQFCSTDRLNSSMEPHFDLIIHYCNQTEDEDIHQSNKPSQNTPGVWIDRIVEGMLPSYGLLTIYNQTNAMWQLIEFKDKSILRQLWFTRSNLPAFNQIKHIKPHGLRISNSSLKETMNVTDTQPVQKSTHKLLKNSKPFKAHSVETITYLVNATVLQNNTSKKDTVITSKGNNTLHKVLNEINNTFRKMYYPSINRNLPYLGKTDERSFTTGAVITGTVIIVMLGIMITGLAWLHCYRREKRKKIRRNKKSPKRKPRVQSNLPYERFLDSRQEFDIEQELPDC